ncbi:MAG: lipopolysaccharide biosynthesis protein [Rhodospirillaceae bacterium]
MLSTSKLLDRRYINRGTWIYLTGLLVRLGARIPLLLIAGRAYGPALYGEFMIAAGLAETVAAVATLGFKRTLFGFMNEAGPGQGGTAVRHGLAIGVALGGVLSAILMFLAPTLAPLFGVPEAAHKIAVFAWIVPVIVATDILLTATFFNRRLRYDVWARCVAEPGTQTVVAGAFYLAGLTQVGLLASYGAALTAACLTALWGYSEQFGLKSLWGRFDTALAVNMTRRSASTGAFDILTMLMSRIDMFVVGHFFSAEGVGLYGMAQQFLTLPDKIGKSFAPVVMPVLSQALHEGDLKRARSALAAMAPRQAALEGILVVAFVAAGAYLLEFFGGHQFVAAAPVLAILAAGTLVNDILSIAGLPLVVARPMINPGAGVLTLAVYLGAIAVVEDSFGIEGVAVISVAAALIGNLWRIQACYQVLFPGAAIAAPAVKSPAE